MKESIFDFLLTFKEQQWVEGMDAIEKAKALLQSRKLNAHKDEFDWERYQPEEMLDYKKDDKGRELFLIKWKGCDDLKNSWVTKSCLTNRKVRNKIILIYNSKKKDMKANKTS